MEDFEEINKLLINYKTTLLNCNAEVFVWRWGGCYKENGNYIKTYYVTILLNNFKTDPFDTLDKYLLSQSYTMLGWSPFTGKGVIDLDKFIDGFENVKPFIDDFLIKIANFKPDLMSIVTTLLYISSNLRVV